MFCVHSFIYLCYVGLAIVVLNGCKLQVLHVVAVTDASFTEDGNQRGAAVQFGEPWQPTIHFPVLVFFRQRLRLQMEQGTTGSGRPSPIKPFPRSPASSTGASFM